MRNLRHGLSGIIRAKNEGRFIGECIDSVIGVLDELVVVYNDCTDDTEEVLERKLEQYPDKLRIFPYNNNILSHDLTKTEFDYAISLPEDSPRLHSSQCNYGLSRVRYEYAVKIDPDQIYFADEIKKWRDICASKEKTGFSVSFISGWFFMMYMSMYRRVSAVSGHPCLALIPDWLVRIFRKPYRKYMTWRLRKGDAAVSLSGVNVFYDGEWFIPFDKYNTHPPYNGEGDTLLFRVSEATVFERYYRPGHPYSVVEKFRHPYKVMIADAPAWFHLHANRAYCEEKVKNTKREHPELFVLPEDFVKMSYKEVLAKMDVNSTTLYQRILFALVHKLGSKTIAKHFALLRGIKSVKS